MKMSSGRIWPYAIGISITMVFGFCVATIVVTQQASLQESDSYMTNYQDADANANELIKAEIAFDKKYKIQYLSDQIMEAGSVIQYKITDINSNPVNDAKIILATSRPETAEFAQTLENPIVENGVYTFNDVSFPKAGVWNIIAKVEAGENSRFFNVKADTRKKEVKIF